MADEIIFNYRDYIVPGEHVILNREIEVKDGVFSKYTRNILLTNKQFIYASKFKIRVVPLKEIKKIDFFGFYESGYQLSSGNFTLVLNDERFYFSKKQEDVAKLVFSSITKAKNG